MNFNQAQYNEVIRRRHKIAVEYSHKKGWSTYVSEQTWAQIMEIRGLQEWKDVPKNVLEEIK